MDVNYEVIADQEKNRLTITFGDLPMPEDQREVFVYHELEDRREPFMQGKITFEEEATHEQ